MTPVEGLGDQTDADLRGPHHHHQGGLLSQCHRQDLGPDRCQRQHG